MPVFYCWKNHDDETASASLVHATSLMPRDAAQTTVLIINRWSISSGCTPLDFAARLSFGASSSFFREWLQSRWPALATSDREKLSTCTPCGGATHLLAKRAGDVTYLIEKTSLSAPPIETAGHHRHEKPKIAKLPTPTRCRFFHLVFPAMRASGLAFAGKNPHSGQSL